MQHRRSDRNRDHSRPTQMEGRKIPSLEVGVNGPAVGVARITIVKELTNVLAVPFGYLQKSDQEPVFDPAGRLRNLAKPVGPYLCPRMDTGFT